MKDLVAMKELEDKVEVTIRWPGGEAEMVRLAGEFNRWQPELMEREEGGGGGWARSLRLRPGRYEYKFVVGDQWRLDCQLPTVLDSSGNTNHVMELTKTTFEMETETAEKNKTKAEKPFPPSTLPARALTRLFTRLSTSEWLKKKFLQIFTLCASMWMFGQSQIY